MDEKAWQQLFLAGRKVLYQKEDVVTLTGHTPAAC